MRSGRTPVWTSHLALGHPTSHPKVKGPSRPGGSLDLQLQSCQLHPLVVPQLSQAKHEPAGRILTPQVEQ
jgi:hypothetical protein